MNIKLFLLFLLAVGVLVGLAFLISKVNLTDDDNNNKKKMGTLSDNSKGCTGTPGNFDYYLMQFSYSPAWCKENPTHSGDPECSGCPGSCKYGLVLHGMWPQYNPGRSDSCDYPQFCSTQTCGHDPTCQSVLPPNYMDSAPEYGGLAQHEWSKHGVCSGLDPSSYFAQAVGDASDILTKAGTYSDAKTLQNNLSIAGINALYYCDSSGNLTGAAVCYDKDGVTLINCPGNVQESSC